MQKMQNTLVKNSYIVTLNKNFFNKRGSLKIIGIQHKRSNAYENTIIKKHSSKHSKNNQSELQNNRYTLLKNADRQKNFLLLRKTSR
jgi:hypothetical protein